MSKLYASLRADNWQEVTRRGHGRITAHLRGWNFGVRVELEVDKDGKVTARVEQTGGSNAPAGVVAWEGEEGKPNVHHSPQLEEYRKLHDGLSDMIEGGRLREQDVPDGYQWLVESLAKLAGMGG